MPWPHPPLPAIWGLPFSNSQELGEAWHSLIGFDLEAEMDATQVEAVLAANPGFKGRILTTPPEFFFGPAAAKELLLTMARNS